MAKILQELKQSTEQLKERATQRANALGLGAAETTALLALTEDPEAPIPLSLGIDDATLSMLHHEASRLRGRRVDERMLSKAMELTRKQIHTPARQANQPPLHRALKTDAVRLALRAAHRQACAGRRPGARGPRPDLATPILDQLGAVCSEGAHLDAARVAYTRWELIQATAHAALNRPVGWQPSSYQSSLRNMPRITQPLTRACIATNIALLRALKKHVPNAGRWLAIDGSAIPAWFPQTSYATSDGRGGTYQEHFDETGYRYLAKTEPVSWRGYWLVTLADLATGLPVTWRLIPASTQETTPTGELLTELLSVWPELKPEALVADKGWDQTSICRMLEADFGIHPVIPLKDNTAAVHFHKDPHLRNASRNGTVRGIDPAGRLICAAHNQAWPTTSIEGLPNRTGLTPGQRDESGRVRAICTHPNDPCGRMTLNIRHDYRRLNYFPHHPEGMPERYAMRLALLAHRNQIEALFNRLKTGLSLGTASSDRFRLRDRRCYEAAISLAFLLMTAEAAHTKDTDLTPTDIDTAITALHHHHTHASQQLAEAA